jgi:uncharacterized membrane protein YbjE (DUF340 family)
LLIGLLLFLAAGLLIGYFVPRDSLRRLAGKLLLGAVFLLVFCMGLTLGTMDGLAEKLTSLGWQAAVVALCAVAGSVGIAVLLTALARRNKR